MKKKKHLKYEEKSLLLKHHFQSNVSLEQLSEQFGVCKGTIYNWLRKLDYDFKNLEKLRHTKERKERKSLIKLELSDWVKEAILELIHKHPEMGALKIKQYFFRHHQIILPEKKIYFFLKEEGIIEARKKKESKKNIEKGSRRFEYPTPLSAVQIDLLTMKLTGGQKLTLVTLLDDHSRFILVSKFIAVKSMKDVMKILSGSIKKYGMMDYIITDKGSEFVSWQSFTDFETLLCSLDIELIASGPQQPQCQGKIERWHKTFRTEFEDNYGGFSYHSEAQLELDRFVNYYNNERPHQALSGLVPSDRFFGLSEDLEKELQEHKNGNRKDQRIYFSCNIRGKKIVVTGARDGDVDVYVNNEKDAFQR